MSTFTPIPEQQKALELFLHQRSLRVDAYAGSGKTSTLRLLASGTMRKGIYLAFNRSIAIEARSTFPSQVQCTTSHSAAYRSIRRHFRFTEEKMTASLTLHAVMEAFRLPEIVSFRAGFSLPGRSYAAVLLEGIRAFTRSNDPQPTPLHIPRSGMLESVPDAEFTSFAEQAAEHVAVVWANMASSQSPLALGHDGYLKLWAMSSPRAQTDYVMVDEAQDLNPVLLGVLRNLGCQLVIVGDPYQQIYEWRGAINAMEQVAVNDRVLLSQSFRFGPAIADAATRVIQRIGAKEPVRGSAQITSHIACVRPDVILSRSNAAAIGNVLASLRRNERCHVLGGTKSLSLLLEDVSRIKAGSPATGQELLGFSSWRDVMAHSVKPEGTHLRPLVTLVTEYGETTMLSALSRCETEEGNAELVCSTTHRAKGREWDYVRLDEDFEAAVARSLSPSSTASGQAEFFAEMRLLYVALSRARLAVELPRELLNRLGLNSTTGAVLGSDRASKTHVSVTAKAASDPPSVSPYHAPRPGESAEIAAVRRFFR